MSDTTKGEDIARVLMEHLEERGIDIGKTLAVTINGKRTACTKTYLYTQWFADKAVEKFWSGLSAALMPSRPSWLKGPRLPRTWAREVGCETPAARCRANFPGHVRHMDGFCQQASNVLFLDQARQLSWTWIGFISDRLVGYTGHGNEADWAEKFHTVGD